MKDLSIVIVSYNVCALLEQALKSVFVALHGLDGEVFVVDNFSADDSVAMVQANFPQVHLIANKENAGFSKANNQAIKKATGKYILLLNPDTVVPADTFRKCCAFMNEHPEAGGLGVKMEDAVGNYLPESKRGLPTPLVAFYKIVGLTALFPQSRRFSRYYLGHLPADKVQEIDVLAGAFMFLRHEALTKTGLLDEDFFMYGEDIDLSYRLQQAGYKNYYLPSTTIVHYKGASTQKDSLKYVLLFYRAMYLFVRKHYSSRQAFFISPVINSAIVIRGGVSVVHRLVKKILP